jgi:hypothetical protein
MAEITEQMVREAPEIEAFKLGLMQSAKALPMPVLPAYQVAGMAPGQEQAIQRGMQGIGAYLPYTQQAREGLTAAQQMATPQGISQYMSPYQQQVIDVAMQNINRQGDIARQNAQAQAVRSGAFGGARAGIQQAELERGLADTRNSTIANLLNQGYQQAANQSLQSAQLQGQLGQGIGALGAQLQGLGQQDVTFQYGLGQQQQGQQQRELDALRASQLQSAYQPFQQLGFLSDIYKGAPSTQMAVTTQSAPAPSPFQQVAGLATGTLATAGALKAAGGLF